MRKHTQSECEGCRLRDTIGSVLSILSLMPQQCSIVPHQQNSNLCKDTFTPVRRFPFFSPPFPWPLLSRSQFCPGTIFPVSFQRLHLFHNTLSSACSFVQPLHSESPCSLLLISRFLVSSIMLLAILLS